MGVYFPRSLGSKRSLRPSPTLKYFLRKGCLNYNLKHPCLPVGFIASNESDFTCLGIEHISLGKVFLNLLLAGGHKNENFLDLVISEELDGVINHRHITQGHQYLKAQRRFFFKK